MKKKIISLILCLVLLAALSSCGGNGPSGEKQSINVYNWGEYIDQSVLDDFEAETGIHVNYTTYASNEEMYSKIVSGAASYDVIIPSEYMISKMISEDLLAELDFSNIPNYKYIGEEYKGLSYDPDEKYSVPYTWGTVVIVYNTKYVDEEDVADESIDLLWNEKYAGNILMFDNPRDAFALAHVKLGHSMNTMNPEDWYEAAEELKKQKPLVQAYVMDQIFDKMLNEEAYIATYYAGDAITMMDENEDLAAYVPKEGANMFFDSMCVLKGSQNKEAAEKFINFMCETEIAVRNAEEVWYAIPHTAAFEALDPEQSGDPLVYPPQEVKDKCEVFINLNEETLILQSELWINLKTQY
ncbi:MAG: spermidine/putrescine ABC transporter substrate-binding protein [Ruminococcaceae bacterium]|nr:spermidine/putrescine ABC transporter substrate-binding protein [Oscillospiraceae bacterium]